MKRKESVNSTLPPDDYGRFSYGERDNQILPLFPKRIGKTDKGSVGERIKSARKSLGYTQEDLAKKCGTTPNIIKNIELGRSSMNSDYLASLSKSLGLSVEAIIFGISSKTVRSGIDLDLGLEQSTIDWLHKQKKDNSIFLRVLNSLFREPDTATALLDAINNYWEAYLLPMVVDSEGLRQPDTSREKVIKSESMKLIEEAIQRYGYSKLRYGNEEECATAERRVKRAVDRMIEERLELKKKTEAENQLLIDKQELITPDEV